MGNKQTKPVPDPFLDQPITFPQNQTRQDTKPDFRPASKPRQLLIPESAKKPGNELDLSSLEEKFVSKKDLESKLNSCLLANNNSETENWTRASKKLKSDLKKEIEKNFVKKDDYIFLLKSFESLSKNFRALSHRITELELIPHSEESKAAPNTIVDLSGKESPVLLNKKDLNQKPKFSIEKKPDGMSLFERRRNQKKISKKNWNNKVTSRFSTKKV